MDLQLSDQVRAVAQAEFVRPASRAGKEGFSIPVRDLMKSLEARGFPRNHTPQICSALQTKKFLRENGLEIVDIDGPDSKMSTTVVVHYRIKGNVPGLESNPRAESPVDSKEEEPQARAKRLVDKLRGLLKQEIADYGGAEAFMRWVRSEDEDAA